MDEPFASVDAQTRADLEDLTMKVQREFGMTVIIVTHDVDEAVYMSNKVIVLGGAPASVTATRSSGTSGFARPTEHKEFGALRITADGCTPAHSSGPRRSGRIGGMTRIDREAHR